MTEPYTASDVQLVAQALHVVICGCEYVEEARNVGYMDCARAALSALAEAGRLATPEAPKHGSDGLMGYESMRCAAGLDGCDDKACICLCHRERSAP